MRHVISTGTLWHGFHEATAAVARERAAAIVGRGARAPSLRQSHPRLPPRQAAAASASGGRDGGRSGYSGGPPAHRGDSGGGDAGSGSPDAPLTSARRRVHHAEAAHAHDHKHAETAQSHDHKTPALAQPSTIARQPSGFGAVALGRVFTTRSLRRQEEAACTLQRAVRNTVRRMRWANLKAFVLVVARHRWRIRLSLRSWRKARAAARLRIFLAAFARDGSKSRVIMRQFVYKIKVAQRACRAHLSFKNARLAVLRMLWEEAEALAMADEVRGTPTRRRALGTNDLPNESSNRIESNRIESKRVETKQNETKRDATRPRPRPRPRPRYKVGERERARSRDEGLRTFIRTKRNDRKRTSLEGE